MTSSDAWGGEEFLVVIEDANAMHAVMLAERSANW